VSAAADSCIASATMSTEVVVLRAAEWALCRFVHRRAYALPVSSANTDLGSFYLAREGQVGLVAGGVSNLDAAVSFEVSNTATGIA
jgi:hypothetical protein